MKHPQLFGGRMILKDWIENLGGKVISGVSSLSGLLLKDDKIYKNLEDATKELFDLIQDIKLYPSRYMNFSNLGGSTPYNKNKKYYHSDIQ